MAAGARGSTYVKVDTKEALEKLDNQEAWGAAHAFLYTKRTPGRRVWELSIETDAVVIMRHDGRLGLVGGGIEKGETPETALERELKEEAGIELNDELKCALRSNLVEVRQRKKASDSSKPFYLLLYAIELPNDTFDAISTNALDAEHKNVEVWGLVHIPFFVDGNLGLPFFFAQSFAYNARQQIATALSVRNLAPKLDGFDNSLAEILRRARRAIEYQTTALDDLLGKEI